MKLANILAGLVVLLGTASIWAAGSASAVIGGGAVRGTSGWSVSGASSTAANGAFITPATVTAAGKQVTMPASAAIAANAAAFAVTAVRLNPAGLFVGLAAQWLIGEGLQWANNSWTKTTPGVADPNNVIGWGYKTGLTGSTVFSSPASACGQLVSVLIGTYYDTLTKYSSSNNWYCYIRGRPPGYGDYLAQVTWQNYCASGYSLSGGVCVPDAQAVPATESDFTAAGASSMPDPVAQELARANVPIPVSDPVLDQTPKVEDYGTPFVDPVTGKTVQTKTRITPSPTPGDPYNVRIESYNVEVAPAPVPDPGDPVPVPADEQPKDPCLDNPDRVGCLNAGSPEDSDLSTWELPFSLTPVSIGGAGACPPDPVFTAAGQSFTIAYKPMCDAAAWLKPLILALAWFSAAGIIAGTVRE